MNIAIKIDKVFYYGLTPAIAPVIPRIIKNNDRYIRMDIIPLVSSPIWKGFLESPSK